MTTDTPLCQQWHENNLDEFRASANGTRNNNLNTLAIKSFSLALGNQELSIATVENDYTAAAKALQMVDGEVVATLRSALDGATPRAIDSNGSNSNGQVTPVKTNMALAPTYTALEDYALAHGVPGSELERHEWEEGVYPYGKYKGIACFIVPHEDGIKRARIKNPDEADGKKWLPIKPEGMKEKITPCWYKFKSAVSMAVASKHKTIVLCNGQPSAITAQYHSIPALAQTDGENKKITTPLLKRLLAATTEHKLSVLLAYDGDDTGRSATNLIQKQLQDNKVTIRIVQFGGDGGYDLADYCKQHKADVFEKLLKLAAYNAQATTDEHQVKELSGAMDDILSNNDTVIAPGNSVMIPFKSFHKFGGYAYMTAPGKMAMIMAPSGHGKTSLMETWVDWWLKSGTDVLFYSPEWDALETHFRRVQRNGGASYDQMRELVLYRNETAEGIAKSQRMGRLLGSNILSKTHMVNNAIKGWPGHVFTYKAQRITETVLEHMGKRLHRQRRDGRRVGIAVFDYMQLMRTQQEVSAKNTYEVLGDMLKDWCVDNHVFGLVGMQVKKSSAQTEDLLGMYDAQWVRPDIFNLIVTLNIKEHEVFENGVGHKKLATIATANICKNSTGDTGEVQLKTNFKHLAWEEV